MQKLAAALICMVPALETALAQERVLFGAREETRVMVDLTEIELGRYVSIQLPDEIPDKWFDVVLVTTIHRLGCQIFVGCIETGTRTPLLINYRGEPIYEYGYC